MKSKLFRLAQAIVIALCLIVVPVSTTGCVRGAIPVLSNVAAVLDDAANILRAIDLTVRSFFFQGDPDARTKYEKLMAGAYAGLGVATKAIAGLEDLDQAKYDEAFEEFKKAYAELAAYLKESGALRSSKLRLGASGQSVAGDEIELPEPMALSYRVR